MYLIKNISFNRMENTIQIINGLSCYRIQDKLECINNFWGKTEIIEDEYADKSRYEENDFGYIIGYASDYKVEDLEDGYKKITYNITEPDEVEGYILLVAYADNIKTDGEVLFRRYPEETVVVLRNNNYITLYDKKAKVIDNVLYIEV